MCNQSEYGFFHKTDADQTSVNITSFFNNLLVRWRLNFIKNTSARDPEIRYKWNSLITGLDVVVISIAWVRGYNNFAVHFR